MLFGIDPAISDSFSPSNHISSLTDFSDFDTFLDARWDFFFYNLNW
jgi:hypothetical protein